MLERASWRARYALLTETGSLCRAAPGRTLRATSGAGRAAIPTTQNGVRTADREAGLTAATEGCRAAVGMVGRLADPTATGRGVAAAGSSQGVGKATSHAADGRVRWRTAATRA